MTTAGKTVWKGMRLDEEVVVCIEEALAEGELSTMVTDAITRHGRLAECRRCGRELPEARRLVDRFCEECYRSISPAVLRRYIELSIPPGKRRSRSAVDATRYPEWVYEPAGDAGETKEWRGWEAEEGLAEAQARTKADAPSDGAEAAEEQPEGESRAPAAG